MGVVIWISSHLLVTVIPPSQEVLEEDGVLVATFEVDKNIGEEETSLHHLQVDLEVDGIGLKELKEDGDQGVAIMKIVIVEEKEDALKMINVGGKRRMVKEETIKVIQVLEVRRETTNNKKTKTLD